MLLDGIVILLFYLYKLTQEMIVPVADTIKETTIADVEGISDPDDNSQFVTDLWLCRVFLWVVSQMPCRIHAPVENTKNLDADAALTKDDHMTLVGIAENAGLEFQAFVPERLIAA